MTYTESNIYNPNQDSGIEMKAKEKIFSVIQKHTFSQGG